MCGNVDDYHNREDRTSCGGFSSNNLKLLKIDSGTPSILGKNKMQQIKLNENDLKKITPGTAGCDRR